MFFSSKYRVDPNRLSSKNLVSKLSYSGNVTEVWQYGYDSNGRIISEINGSVRSIYSYDGQGQLVRATVNGVSTDYVYDTAGNIRSKTGHSYEYDNPQWRDQLTAYDGGEITYDECGNPLEYYTGSSFTWTQGRKLESANVYGTRISYTYDIAGVRSGKTVGSTSYSFTTLSGLVTRQTWGDSAIDFVYDENNQPLAMRYNGTWYYYVLNLQGDVVKLVREDGAIVASYSYDPWGKVLTSSGSLADVNPLRYRGYYYDAETGFYYLQSRYYDPEIGRFINADSYATTDAAGLLSTNMYAYCENNPIIFCDNEGTYSFLCTELGGNPVTAGAISKKPKINPKYTEIANVAAGGGLGSYIGIDASLIKDDKGNYYAVATFKIGGGVGSNLEAPSIKDLITLDTLSPIKVENIYDLQGWSYSMGGTIGVVSIEWDGSVAPAGIDWSVATSLGIDFHVTGNYTIVRQIYKSG